MYSCPGTSSEDASATRDSATSCVCRTSSDAPLMAATAHLAARQWLSVALAGRYVLVVSLPRFSAEPGLVDALAIVTRHNTQPASTAAVGHVAAAPRARLPADDMAEGGRWATRCHGRSSRGGKGGTERETGSSCERCGQATLPSRSPDNGRGRPEEQDAACVPGMKSALGFLAAAAPLGAGLLLPQLVPGPGRARRLHMRCGLFTLLRWANQPPLVKLVLGHDRNARLPIAPPTLHAAHGLKRALACPFPRPQGPCKHAPMRQRNYQQSHTA